MIFKALRLVNFRNIRSADIKFSDDVNVICGENAQGKTNLLEALWLFTGTKSFRGAKDKELVLFGEESAKITLFFNDDGRDQRCDIKIDGKRQATLNDVPQSAASEIAGKMPAVIFSPADLGLIKDGPAARRKFLDTSICQLYPAFIDVSKKYIRALDQRNKILKEIKYNENLLSFIEDFENEMAVSGAAIVGYRKRYLEKLKTKIPDIYGGISDCREKMTAEYAATAGDDSESFKKALFAARKNDVILGSTSIGPHRDDIKIDIDGISARSFGSQGQKRSAALSLKLGESEVFYEITGKKPVLLLDDVLSELDEFRQNYILNSIKSRQVFITCCDKSSTDKLKAGRILEVSGGNIKAF